MLTMLRDTKTRGIIFQILIFALFASTIGFLAYNYIANTNARGISTTFSFLSQESKIDITGGLFEHTRSDTYWHALGLVFANTLLVAGTGIIFATLFGFIVGVARLSPNWLVNRIAYVYVEAFRNVPLLLWIFLIYIAIFLKSIPNKTDAVPFLGGNLFTNSGFFIVKPIGGETFGGFWWVFLGGVVISIVASIVSRRQNKAIGRGISTGPIWLLGVFILPALYFILMWLLQGDQFVTFSKPEVTRFAVKSEWTILPEYMALLLALTLYTSAFIAEIVRAGIVSVSGGQKEAASALGLSRGQTLKKVIIPQAMRVIVPPLTSQYLNLTKNSSLGFAIGFFEVTSLTMGTIPSQEGAALQGVLIAMLIYGSLSLTISLVMNTYNRTARLKER